jgi:hypothetical protein
MKFVISLEYGVYNYHHRIECTSHDSGSMSQRRRRWHTQSIQLTVAVGKVVGIRKTKGSTVRRGFVMNRRPCHHIVFARRQRCTNGKGKSVRKGIFQPLQQRSAFGIIRQVGRAFGATKNHARVTVNAQTMTECVRAPVV